MPGMKNHLLALLPRNDRCRVLACCDPVQLTLSEVLSEPGTIAQYAYFPTEGFISLVTSIDRKPVLEVGMVGCEGMLGAQLGSGIKTSALHALVQGGGGCLAYYSHRFSPRAGRQSAITKVYQSVSVCPHGTVSDVRRVSAVPYNHPTAGAMAANDPGSCKE